MISKLVSKKERLGENLQFIGSSSFFSLLFNYSHASLLINEYPLIIKDRLGHEDIRTTLSTYSHLYPNMNFEIVNNMSDTIQYNTSTEKQAEFQGEQAFKY